MDGKKTAIITPPPLLSRRKSCDCDDFVARFKAFVARITVTLIPLSQRIEERHVRIGRAPHVSALILRSAYDKVAILGVGCLYLKPRVSKALVFAL